MSLYVILITQRSSPRYLSPQQISCSFDWYTRWLLFIWDYCSFGTQSWVQSKRKGWRKEDGKEYPMERNFPLFVSYGKWEETKSILQEIRVFFAFLLSILFALVLTDLHCYPNSHCIAKQKGQDHSLGFFCMIIQKNYIIF